MHLSKHCRPKNAPKAKCKHQEGKKSLQAIFFHILKRHFLPLPENGIQFWKLQLDKNFHSFTLADKQWSVNQASEGVL